MTQKLNKNEHHIFLLFFSYLKKSHLSFCLTCPHPKSRVFLKERVDYKINNLMCGWFILLQLHSSAHFNLRESLFLFHFNATALGLPQLTQRTIQRENKSKAN